MSKNSLQYPPYIRDSRLHSDFVNNEVCPRLSPFSPYGYRCPRLHRPLPGVFFHYISGNIVSSDSLLKVVTQCRTFDQGHPCEVLPRVKSPSPIPDVFLHLLRDLTIRGGILDEGFWFSGKER